MRTHPTAICACAAASILEKMAAAGTANLLFLKGGGGGGGGSRSNCRVKMTIRPLGTNDDHWWGDKNGQV